MSIESRGKAIAEINPESGLNRRPGMPSVTKLNINDITKYYMVVESNDKTYINNDENAINNSMGVAIALFSSLDGENWEFNKLLFTDHGTSRAGAPYVIALPNGKIAFSFQCLDNSIEGTVGDTDGPYKRRVYTYISKENTEEPKDR